ncbi:MAG TPA: Hsp20/alpha crystallin family protein [Bacteroidia bacterium]|nr:Hsp20/alpha crystallin family protein [Bacteroidia bacterium]
MANLTLSRKRLRPTWKSDLFDTEDFFSPRLWDFSGDFDFANRVPSVNITENEQEFKIEMAAPGFERKDFKVEVENGVLCISSEKEEESEEKKKNYTRMEYSFNSFSRSFALPENSLPDKINAKYEKGVLNIVVPKKEVTVSKPVKEITVS